MPTGTNLLGLVKHVASVEFGYFGETFGRPSGEPLPWFEDGAEPNADMWATPDESREQIVALYHRAWANSDATIDALTLDAQGHVPWWPAERNEVTLHRILVHMLAETNRHAVTRTSSASSSTPPRDCVKATTICRPKTKLGGRPTGKGWSTSLKRPAETDARGSDVIPPAQRGGSLRGTLPKIVHGNSAVDAPECAIEDAPFEGRSSGGAPSERSTRCRRGREALPVYP